MIVENRGSGSSSDGPDWCTCEHSYGAHEFGLCQVVINDYPRRHCPCKDPSWDDE